MRRVLLLSFVLLLTGAAGLLARQFAPLTIVNAGPNGVMRQLQDANEIHVTFSEPMIPLGSPPSGPAPPWIRITPAIGGQYRWSGTTRLIFTPDPATPLPYSTRYSVTIDATATSAAGRALGAPFTFTFTTPTAQLMSLRSYRRGDRFDRPAVLVLQFNQPVRPADVAAHAVVRFQPYALEPPVLAARDRARLLADDPDGLRRFDAKVAAIRQITSRTDTVPVRPTDDWARDRFPIRGPAGRTLPPEDHMVALETAVTPPAGASLLVTLDTGLPGLQGPATPADAQQSSVMLERPFFSVIPCVAGCDPSGYNAIQFTVPVLATEFPRLIVHDVTDPSRERALTQTPRTPLRSRDSAEAITVEDAGYPKQPPAATWRYELPPALEAIDGQRLDAPWLATVENRRETPFTSFGDGHGVWETGGGPLPFHARNYQDVMQWIVPISPRDLMPRILDVQRSHFRTLPPGDGAPRRLSPTPDTIQSYGLDLGAALSPAGSGLVWAGLRRGAALPNTGRPEASETSTIVQVTNLGISVKDSPDSTLIFVTRLDNGEAVAGAAVAIVNDRNQQVWRGTTARDGVALAPALSLRRQEWEELPSFIVTAAKDGDVAYVCSDWNEGIEAWSFGLPYSLMQATDILRGAVFTDRGVYKPGEDVRIKTIVRADTTRGVRLLPAGARLDVEVRDSRNKIVDARTVTVSAWSSAEWSFAVPATAALGRYVIEASLEGTKPPEGSDVSHREEMRAWLKRIDGSFLVAAYRKPGFRVSAGLQASSPIAGAALTGTIDARYLFGNAVAGRPVAWTITRRPELRPPAAILEAFDKAYRFGYVPEIDRHDVKLAGQSATLDASGRLTVDVPSTTGGDFAYSYTFEGDVEDVTRQHIANSASVVLHPAPWYIGLKLPQFFVNPASGTSVDVVASDLQGRPTAGVPVTLTLVRTQWHSVRRAEGGGFYTWDTERQDTTVGQWTMTTASTPVPVRIAIPEGGSYLIRAEARDEAGRATRTDVRFYGTGNGYTAWERYDHNRVTLEPERRTWKPGETARVMIQSPWESATALLTVEREGIRNYQRFTLASTQQTVSVPITERDIPNVYVSVLLIRGRTSTDPGSDGSDPGKPAFRLGYTELKVEDETKKLAVAVRADRSDYRPSTKARVEVVVTDSARKGASSEVTLWAVDDGVLSLTGYQLPDVLRAVYREKALQVKNGDSRQRIVSRRVLTPKGGGEGGGGGEGALANVRKDFRPLAFWLGSVATDGRGRATREVTLPDALTTYRIMAVAADRSSRFGSASAEIRVNKPVMILAAFPRFMSLGDTASFGAVVSNTLATGGPATVTIRSLTPALLDFGATTSRTITLTAGANEPVRFDARARGTGLASVVMTVTAGTSTDAFETTLPVQLLTPLQTTAAFGDTAGAPVTEKLMLPGGIVPGLGGLQVDLSSTALVGLGEGARYLTDYAYFCAEQKASAALALVLAADVGQAFQMGRIAPADYRTRAAGLLAELPRYQCSDGGFSLWPGPCRLGSAYLTAYVLHVIRTATALGLEASDPQVVGRALEFLARELTAPAPGEVQWRPMWGASQAFGVKVLAEHGFNQDGNITRLVNGADSLPVFALSYLADAMAAMGTRGPRYDDVIRRLGNALRLEGDQAHLQELEDDALLWIWNSNVRTTALVLDGFVRRGDRRDAVPPLVRGLLAARRNGRWGSTQENAASLEALMHYYKAFEADAPDMTAAVSIGGASIGGGTFKGRSSAVQSVRLSMPDLARQITAGVEQDLAVTRAGRGHLYYAARLQFAPAAPLPAVDQGIRVERRYEKFIEGGSGPASTMFDAGDLIRVTLTITMPKERRFVAVTDPLPAGVEAVDGWFRTTASDLAQDAGTLDADASWFARFRRGGFDHIEKYDDRVQLFATRLSEGRHQFSYLVRATAAGTFHAAGARAEEMYSPEVHGRAPVTTVVIR